MNPSKDLVFYKDKDGSYMSGGYSIQSELFESVVNRVNEGDGLGVMGDVTTDNNTKLSSFTNSQTGGSTILMSEVFKNLAVPTGLLFLQQTFPRTQHKDDIKKNTISGSNNGQDIYEESLYDKLVSMVSPNKKKNYNRKTRRVNKRRGGVVKKGTRRNRV